MTEDQLTTIAKKFLKDNYNLHLHIPIKRNNRLRTTYGRFVMNKQMTPLRIEISGITLTYGHQDVIIGVLKHECIHYALHTLGKVSKDGDPYFESELKKHGAPSTNTTKIGKFHLFTCNHCGQQFESSRKQLVRTPENYRTTCCKAALTIVGERIYNGKKLSIT